MIAHHVTLPGGAPAGLTVTGARVLLDGAYLEVGRAADHAPGEPLEIVEVVLGGDRGALQVL